MYHDGYMGWGMGLGGILFWIVLILVIAAIAKYLFSKPGGRG